MKDVLNQIVATRVGTFAVLLLGLYVVLFFIVAQVLAKVRFHQTPTPPILLGGSLIILGGMIITFWQK
jgi:small multidrug resistance family-3 protein